MNKTTSSQAAAERSGEFFQSGHCCAESVIMALAEVQDIDSDLIPRIATGFCGGIAQTSGLCGAVSGAVMGINLNLGRQTPDREKKAECYAAVQEFIRTFKGQFGSTNCQTLSGCDLSTEEGQQTFKDKNVAETCTEYVQEAARIAADILEL